MTIVVCPGYHPPQLTLDFLRGLGRIPDETPFQDIIYPAHCQPPYSSLHVLAFVRHRLSQVGRSFEGQQTKGQQTKGQQPEEQEPEAGKSQEVHQKRYALVFIGFSAGVVGAIGAAQAWQAGGGLVKALIAIDGWGVPLWGNFPIHRMSHDAFTHWSSAWLGSGADGFYADPGVRHLDLWRSPQHVCGYRVKTSSQAAFASSKSQEQYQRTTAATLLNEWLCQYDEVNFA